MTSPIEPVEVRVTVNAPTKLHREKLIKFVGEHGVTKVRRVLPTRFTFVVEKERAIFLLVEMRHKFRIAYASGWTEPNEVKATE